MRVIGGTHGGRRLSTVPGSDVRPTSDRARESLFNSLFSRGFPDGHRVIDAFAGSGALGIEALSRGATAVTFLEQRAEAVAAIESNLRELELEDRAVVVRGDAVSTIGRADPAATLVLADPPYEFDDWSDFLSRCPPGFVVAESDREIDAPTGWRLVRSRKLGRAVFTFFESDE